MLRKLIRNQDAIAATEFALTLPFFVFTVMGGMELAWEAITRQKAQAIATSTADNIARIRGSIDETDIEEAFTAAEINGKGMDLRMKSRIIVSSIQQNPQNNGNWIRWQRCMGSLSEKSKYGTENQGRDNASIPNIGPNNMQPPSGNAVIIVEMTYEPEALISESFFGKEVIKTKSIHLVRDRTDLGITNVKGRTINRC